MNSIQQLDMVKKQTNPHKYLQRIFIHLHAFPCLSKVNFILEQATKA